MGEEKKHNWGNFAELTTKKESNLGIAPGEFILTLYFEDGGTRANLPRGASPREVIFQLETLIRNIKRGFAVPLDKL